MVHRTMPLMALLLAGCAAKPADAPPEWLPGKYHYVGSGTLAKRFPWQAEANLVLDRDAQYTLEITVHIDDKRGGDTDSHDTYGTYHVEGDRLILEPANEHDDDVEVFEIHGHQLVPKLGWPARLALKGFRIPNPVFVKSE